MPLGGGHFDNEKTLDRRPRLEFGGPVGEHRVENSGILVGEGKGCGGLRREEAKTSE